MKLLSYFTLTVCFLCLLAFQSDKQSHPKKYRGKPYTDAPKSIGVQKIPGKVECEYFDFGGDSIAYHDADCKNNGSGALNKGEGYLNNFRINEGPDISYTKFHDTIDNSPYSIVQPEKDKLYLCWTEPGEWTRYTVDVQKSGNYKIGVMYTSNRGGAIQLVIDDKDSTNLLNITSTSDKNEPIAWRQWHHWNYTDSLTTHHLKAGRRVITLKIVSLGNFNFDYLKFTAVKK